jgi:riboflavin transporter FmnP
MDKKGELMNARTKQIAITALLSAAAYVVMVIVRMPFVPGYEFLLYDPKDVILAFGGFLFGPLTAFGMSVLVSFLEMVTVSKDGPVGMLMNVVSSCSLVCTAAFVYKKKRTIWGAAVGLAAGVLFMAFTMVLWNYIVTPWYRGFPREAVRPLLLTIFLPFNLIKGGINAAAAMLLYKPLITALRKLGMVPRPSSSGSRAKTNIAGLGAALFVLASCVLAVLIWQGKI